MSEKNTSFHHDTGKGSRPRSYSVTQEEFKQKFDAIDWSVKADSKEESGCGAEVEVVNDAVKADEG